VSLVSILAKEAGVGASYSIPQILMISIPASLSGVLLAALWSMRRGKDLDDDPEFQRKIADPDQYALIYGTDETLLTQRFPKEAFRSTWIFFAGIATVVVLGAFASLRPTFVIDGETEKLSMNLAIQMAMLVAGALILIFCKVKPTEINNGAVFKAGMTAIFAVYGVAWMADTFFSAHIDALKESLAGVVQGQPWTYAIVLFIVSKLVNSQAAALVAIAPIGLALGVDPTLVIAFFGASYGYFILPTYPSDLACIGFDRTGTTHIGKFVINHSFIIPGLISVFTSCAVGYALVSVLL
jgi:anaerobic C4-dicarboxylate transporter DcuB